jgi:sugar lactone lactonase YvrE
MKLRQPIKTFGLILFFSLLIQSCSMVSHTYYPEGPTIYNGQLYYVEYSTGKVKKYINEGEIQDFWKDPQCGPAGLLVMSSRLIVSCYDKNTIATLNSKGKLLKQKIFAENLNGPNDFAQLDQESYLVTFSGKFDPKADASGKLVLMRKEKSRVLADKLYYPNGVAIHHNKVYISEHLKNRIVEFELKDNQLVGRKVFFDLPKVNQDPYLGPDGLKFDPKTNSLFVAQYGGARVYQITIEGKKIIKTWKVSPSYPTNILINGDSLVITAVTDANNRPYPGVLIRKKL